MMSSTNRLEFGDDGTYIFQSADGVLDLVSDTEIEINATTIDMNGAIDLSGDLTLAGDIVFNAAGKGICLGVTSNTDANTLDDYEEGVFTVTATTGSGTITVNTGNNTLAYTKIGRVVHIQGVLSFSAISSPSGDLYFDAMPFANASGLAEGGPYAAGSVYLTGGATAVSNLIGFIDEATTRLYIREGGTTGDGNDVANHIDTGSTMMLQVTYQIPA